MYSSSEDAVSYRDLLPRESFKRVLHLDAALLVALQHAIQSLEREHGVVDVRDPADIEDERGLRALSQHAGQQRHSSSGFLTTRSKRVHVAQQCQEPLHALNEWSHD